MNLMNDQQGAQKIDFPIGGQAVIEGVMMRSPAFVSISVRKKNGSIKQKLNPFVSLTAKHKTLKIPLVRGIVNLFEMMIIGMNAINFSANEYAEDMEEETKTSEQQKTDKPKSKALDALFFAFSIILSLALAIFLFKYIPLAITEYLRKIWPAVAKYYLLFNAIDGSIRIAIFIAYIFSLSLFKSFRRIFEYHGAEHMAVHTYEKKLPLTVENARAQSTQHPRCGTSFLFIILIASIIIYSFVPRNPVFWLNLTQRLAVLPLIAAVGYEILKWSAKRINNPLVKIVVAPGLWSQRITAKKPDDQQLEVALDALSNSLKSHDNQSIAA